MNNEILNFKKQRELGEILGDTFKFIRLQWKPLFGLILRIAGPAMLLLLLAYLFYMQTMFGASGSMDASPIYFTTGNFGASLVIAMVIILISAIAYYGLMYGTVMHSIRSYVNNHGKIVKSEVISGVKQDFWKLVGNSILVGLIVAAGTVLCILPGIYFGVVLTTTYSIIVFERKGVTDAISYSFELIKGQWWITFATLLVLMILYYVMIMIGQIPQYIYFFIKMFTEAGTFTADPASMFDWVYIALNGLAMVIQYLTYVVVVIAGGIIYFNLNERKHHTGTIETIESLGKRDTI
ncbi:MAG: hypothetical protein R3359_06140 [Marinirhabdus sp.]|nr:hypothetical protein [Marinirhabdus sp.]